MPISSSRKNKIRQLTAPFEDDENPWMKKYHCQCKSCQMSASMHPWLPRFFIFGILCPIFWLVNLLGWWYLQFWQPHELEFQNFQEDEYPGFYERDIVKKRSLVHLKKEVLQEIRTIQDLSDSNSEEDLNNDDVYDTQSSSVKADPEQPESDEEALEKYRYAFLKKVAHDILATHDSLRKSFRDWNLRSLLGIVIDSVLILFIALLCKETR
ncbi:a-specific protein [Saccharomyces pastorianus]|nr:a-specific protein [Saccharomyces pastorianus]